MNCPKCGMEAMISASHNAVTGDASPETPTKLFRVLTFQCRNPQCEKFGKEVGQQRLEQKIEQ